MYLAGGEVARRMAQGVGAWADTGPGQVVHCLQQATILAFLTAFTEKT